MKRLWCLVPLLLAACVDEIELPEIDSVALGNEVEVVLDISGGGFVKSSLSLDEYLVTDLALCVYRNGIQVHQEYYTSAAQTLKLNLVQGQTYNFYVLANASNCCYL